MVVTFLIAACALVMAGLGPPAFDGRQPQLAEGGGAVFLTFATEATISVARSTDGGVTFGTPSAIAVPGRLALGMRRGPRIAATDRAVMVAGVAGARGGGADGDVLLWRSTDGGATWDAPRRLNAVPAAAREGLHGLAAGANGLVVAAWLDLRERGTRIYAAVSRDHGWSWGPDSLVYESPSGTVCECCAPSVAVAPDGLVAIMFRNSAGGARDLHVAISRDGARTFAPARKQGTGSWRLDACPMDGGGVAWLRGTPVSVWRREGQLFTVRGDEPERLLAEGSDPVIAAGADDLVLAWTTPAGVVVKGGQDAPVAAGRGRFPALVRIRGAAILAWEDAGRVRVRVFPRRPRTDPSAAGHRP